MRFRAFAAAPLALVLGCAATIYLADGTIVNKGYALLAQQYVVVLVGVVAYPGLRASWRALRAEGGRKIMAIVGVSVNALLVVLGTIVVGLWIFKLASPAIKGSISINGQPVTNAELFLLEPCDRAAAATDMRIVCDSGFTRGEYLSPWGTFTYWGADPGENSLSVVIYPMPPGECRSASPGVSVRVDEGTAFAPVVLRASTEFSVESGLGARTHVDIDLICE